MAIELDNIASGYHLSRINNNFQKIEDVLNEQMLWREGYVSGETLMRRDLDMNGYNILNLPYPGSFLSPVRLKDVADILNKGKLPEATDGTWMTTLQLGIQAFDATTDNTAAFQSALTHYPNLIVNTEINIFNTVEFPHIGGILRGQQEGKIVIRSANMNDKPALAILGDHAIVDSLIMDNPEERKAKTGGRQIGIDIRADFVTVKNCTLYRMNTGVAGRSAWSPLGCNVIANRFFEQIGVGDNAGAGEDRGDAVVIWGGGSLIAYNYAQAKAGEDCRIAFHFEAPVSSIITPRPEYDRQHNMIIGNRAYGPFRRHFVFEGITNGMCIGNVSLGGATWWCEAYIICKNILAENTLLYTRTSDIVNGSNWNPTRGAIAVGNSTDNVTIRSTAYLAEGSSGVGFTIQNTGSHKFDLDGVKIVNLGSTDAIGCNLILPTDVQVRNSYFRGFGRGVMYTQRILNGEPSKVSVSNCIFELNGTSDGLVSTIGSEGILSVSDTEFRGCGGAVINATNLSELYLTNVRGTASTYFTNLFGIKKTCYMNGLINTSDTRLGVRYAGSLSGDHPDIRWTSTNHSGVYDNHRTSAAHLSNAASVQNTFNKYSGKVVATAQGVYCCGVGDPTGWWIALSGTAGDIQPA